MLSTDIRRLRATRYLYREFRGHRRGPSYFPAAVFEVNDSHRNDTWHYLGGGETEIKREFTSTARLVTANHSMEYLGVKQSRRPLGTENQPVGRWRSTKREKAVNTSRSTRVISEEEVGRIAKASEVLQEAIRVARHEYARELGLIWDSAAAISIGCEPRRFPKAEGAL